ncbi:retrovirus-related pol polyprotein from transposon TNT 1-94 [Tanacetum coccineum]
MPLKHDLSFTSLEEFASEPIVIKPVVVNSEAKACVDKPKIVRKNNSSPIIKDWVSDSEEENVPPNKNEKKTVKSSFAKIDFVKSKEMTHPSPKRNMVPKAVLMKSGLVSLTTTRPVSTAQPKTTVNSARPMANVFKKAHSTVRGPINNKTTFKNSNFNQRVNTVKDKNVNTASPKAIFNAVKGNDVNTVRASACWVWRLKQTILDHVSKHNSALMKFKRFDYIDAQGRSKSGTCPILLTLKKLMEDMLPLEVTPKEGKSQAKNRALVVKPHNKTPYELFHGRTPTLSFLRPFGCPVTILNTIDHLGKFDGKADKSFFVGYSLNSKAFRVFNSRTKIVEENLHIRFSENTLNIKGNKSNGNAGTQACDNAGKAKMEIVPRKDYILLPLWTTDPPFYQDPKSSPNDGSKPSRDDEKKVDEDLREESECKDQEKEDNVNSTNNVKAAITNEVNTVGGKTSIKLPDDLNMPELEDIVYSDDDEDVGAEADMNNLDAFMPVSLIPTTRVHKNHPVEQIIGDLNLAPQIRRMTKNLEEYGVEFKDLGLV